MPNYKPLRGGSWDFIPRYCRSAERDRIQPGIAYYGVGFRVVCPVSIKSIQLTQQSMDRIYSLEIRYGDFRKTEVVLYGNQSNPESNILATVTIYSSWQNAEDGAVYRVDVPVAVVHAVCRELDGTDHGLEPDAETSVRQWMREFEHDLELAAHFNGKSQLLNWVKIRTGTINR